MLAAYVNNLAPTFQTLTAQKIIATVVQATIIIIKDTVEMEILKSAARDIQTALRVHRPDLAAHAMLLPQQIHAEHTEAL